MGLGGTKDFEIIMYAKICHLFQLVLTGSTYRYQIQGNYIAIAIVPFWAEQLFSPLALALYF